MIVFAFIFLSCTFSYSLGDFIEQVHLSLGKDVSEIGVNWVIQGKQEESSVVELKKSTNQADIKLFNGHGYPFNAGNERFLTVYHTPLTGLQPETEYSYRMKYKNTVSEWFSFKTLPQDPSKIRIAFYGDLGTHEKKKDKAVTADLIEKMAKNREMDIVLHVGDFAYDMNEDDGKKGDKFFNMIEPIASRVPYQVVAGNHEQEDDLSYNQYNHRFNMIDSNGKINNFFYSFNVGLVHFIAMNSEYYEDDQTDKIKEQYQFLEQDLIKANQNRQSRPWIVVMMHHPFYCKEESTDECKEFRQFKFFKKGMNPEELFYKYGVDVTLAGHEHLYKRSYPVFRNVVCSSKTNKDNPYDQPEGPIHYTSGAAGRKPKPLFKFPATYRVFGLEKIGINVIHSVTKNSMTIDFIERVEKGVEKVSDRVTITNNNLSGKRYSCPEAEKASLKNFD